MRSSILRYPDTVSSVAKLNCSGTVHSICQLPVGATVPVLYCTRRITVKRKVQCHKHKRITEWHSSTLLQVYNTRTVYKIHRYSTYVHCGSVSKDVVSVLLYLPASMPYILYGILLYNCTYRYPVLSHSIHTQLHLTPCEFHLAE